MYRTLEGTSNPKIHPEPDEPGILKVEETVQEYYSGIRECPACLTDDLHQLEDVNVDNDMRIKRCLRCGHHFGVDDLTSVYDVDAIVSTWKMRLCECGNEDVHRYKFLGKEGGSVYLQCMECDRRIDFPKTDRSDISDSAHSKESNDFVTEESNKISCYECGNTENDLFEFHMDEQDSERCIGVKCIVCYNEQSFEDENDYNSQELEERQDDSYMSEIPTDGHQSKPVGRFEVKNAWELHEGDHLAWWRPEGYWHHAMVEGVYPESNEVSVLHYNGPSPNGGLKTKGMIMQEKIKLDEEKGLLYKIKYSGPCYPSHIAINRGYKRLGEDSYSILTNNCEHFVRWCKTGFDCSNQVKCFQETWARIAGKLTMCFSKDAAKKGIGFVFARGILGAAGSAAVQEGAAVVGEGLSFMTAQKLCECVGVGAIVAIEAASVGRDIYNAHNQRKEGHISRDEFINVVVRRTSQGVVGATGAAIGAYAGQALIPIPIIGGLVGCTLGAAIGHYVGHLGGYAYASYQRNKKDK